MKQFNRYLVSAIFMRKCVEWRSSNLSPYFNCEVNLVSAMISSRSSELYERKDSHLNPWLKSRFC
ncbi:hypothetical protein PUN28_013220 [Cardiocondyla obscurior]|uniref:Uncharacterized protein n=1 Tax=Cardiocondyla obscurior TaxID=286306 RepID=A0AAW2F7J0_9HYME